VEPYHVAGGFDGLARVPSPDDPEATVKMGLRKQQRVTGEHFARFSRDLAAQGHKIKDAVILTGRGKLAASLAKILNSHAQIHVAEGVAVRQSVEEALTAQGIRVHRLDEKSLPDLVSERLGLTESEAFEALSEARAADAGTWKKEQKICALAAWLGVV